MNTPGHVTCDFCKERIDHDLPFPSLSVPMTMGLREKIRDMMVRHATLSLVGADPAGVDVVIPRVMVPLESVPPNFKLEICMGCVEGFLPDVNRILEEQVMLQVQRKIEVQQKRARFGIQSPDDEE